MSVQSKYVTLSAKNLGVIFLTSLGPSLMFSACVALLMSQYILAYALLRVEAVSSPSPSCWGLKGRGRPCSTDTLPGKGMWKKIELNTIGLSCLSGSYVLMGSKVRLTAEAGTEEGSALLWQHPSFTPSRLALWNVLAWVQAPCLPQCPCKLALQCPGSSSRVAVQHCYQEWLHGVGHHTNPREETHWHCKRM